MQIIEAAIKATGEKIHVSPTTRNEKEVFMNFDNQKTYDASELDFTAWPVTVVQKQPDQVNAVAAEQFGIDASETTTNPNEGTVQPPSEVQQPA